MSLGSALIGWRRYAAAALVSGIVSGYGVAVVLNTLHGQEMAALERDWARERAAQSQLLAQAQEGARVESERRYQAINEVRDEADQNLARVVAAERVATDERVRDAVADYARRHRAAASHPDATQSGQAAADPIGMLAVVLGELDDMAEVYAAEADRARVAGLACERSYDALGR